MLPREVAKYVYDMAQAADHIQAFVAGRSFEDFVSDAMLRSAVERQFEIIGEALNQALRLRPTLSDRISDTGRIVSFRNRLIHGYASIAPETVWGIVEGNLPVLHAELAALLV